MSPMSTVQFSTNKWEKITEAKQLFNRSKKGQKQTFDKRYFRELHLTASGPHMTLAVADCFRVFHGESSEMELICSHFLKMQ